MSRWNIAWMLGVPFAGLFCFVVLVLGDQSESEHENYRLVRKLVDVLSEVDKHYVRDLTSEEKEKLIGDMINGGLAELDPYSGYFSPTEYNRFLTQSEGNFGGIGVQIAWESEFRALRVLSPMVGTPAYEAGLLAGDLILRVEGEPIREMTQDEAVRRIMGEPGTDVTLTVLHETADEPIDVTITRAIIEIHSVMGFSRDTKDPAKWEYFADREAGIAYVRVDAFNDKTASELTATVREVQNAGAKGLILDLRDNPGGLLDSAIKVSDLFLREGEIVSTKNRRSQDRSWSAKSEGTLLEPASNHPIAVLINENSASAAEIVAAALKDNGRAVVVGNRSFGKGSVQNILEIDDGGKAAALKLTTASYWRPSKKNIHRFPGDDEDAEWGVKPTEGMEVKLDREERLKFLLDRRQREAVKGKPAALPKLSEGAKKELKEAGPFEDRALLKAVEHLKSKLREVGEAPLMMPTIRA